jgi:hypothetical protein
MALNEQELRNCVFSGLFNDSLERLEKDQEWRRVKGGSDPEPRFKEREMILRFFAFANRLDFYTGKLKRFLNEYMELYAPRDAYQIEEQATMFRQAMQNIYIVFGDNSARLYISNPKTKNGKWDTKFSIAALDIQASALMHQPPAKIQTAAEQIREQFLLSLLTNHELQDAISGHTAGTKPTRLRWTEFRRLVQPIVDGTITEPRFFDYQFRQGLYGKLQACAICGNEIHSFDDSTVDHKTPYSKGGKTIPENGQLAHRTCNASKNMSPG